MAVITDDQLRELIAYAEHRETLFMTEPANIAALAKELLEFRERAKSVAVLVADVAQEFPELYARALEK